MSLAPISPSTKDRRKIAFAGGFNISNPRSFVEAQDKSIALNIGSSQYGSGSRGLVFNETAKKFYISSSVSSRCYINVYSYTNINDLTSGVTFDGAVDITADIPEITTSVDFWVATDGVQCYMTDGGYIYQCILGIAWDFSSIILLSDISMAELSANSNLEYSVVYGMASVGSDLVISTRVGFVGNFYYLAKVPKGSMSSTFVRETFNGSVWLPDPSADVHYGPSGQHANVLGSNPKNGKVYAFHYYGGGPNDLYEYNSNLQQYSTTSDMSGILGTSPEGIWIPQNGSQLMMFEHSDKRIYTVR